MATRIEMAELDTNDPGYERDSCWIGDYLFSVYRWDFGTVTYICSTSDEATRHTIHIFPHHSSKIDRQPLW